MSSGLKILWTPELRERFAKFLRSKRRPAGEEHIKIILSYLDRYMPPEGVERPEEVFDAFMRCPESTRHHLDRAFRNLLNFYERVLGYPKEFINRLREAIPTPRVHPDKWVPGEELVVQSLRLMRELVRGERDIKYLAFYNAQLDCPTRPTHLAEMLENFDPARLERTDKGFYKYRLDIERGTKSAWIAYLTPSTVRLLEKLHERGERITFNGLKCWLRRRKAGTYTRPDGKTVNLPLRPKYIRKFVMNVMRRLGVSKDVAQFLAGQRPRGVDETHYLDLELLADEQYPLYVKYVEELRRRALED